MAALFSFLAVACAADAAFTAMLAGGGEVTLDKARRLANAAHVILACGAICLIAARLAQ